MSRHTMENYIQNNKLVEFGEYKKCLYGTSVESIRKAYENGESVRTEGGTSGEWGGWDEMITGL